MPATFVQYQQFLVGDIEADLGTALPADDD